VSKPRSVRPDQELERQLLVVAVLAFVGPVFVIIAVVKLITGGHEHQPSRTTNERRSASPRAIKPVGEVKPGAGGGGRAPSAPVRRSTDAACFSACHTAGLMNSPKPGDKAAWGPRIAQGEQTLVSHADFNGIPPMPAKGGQIPACRMARFDARRDLDGETSRARTSRNRYPPRQPRHLLRQPPLPAAVAPAPRTGLRRCGKTAPGNRFYQQAVPMCHNAGLAGAPKLGDAAAGRRASRRARTCLHDHAIKGIRAMPAKGGNPSLPDAEGQPPPLDYMLSAVK